MNKNNSFYYYKVMANISNKITKLRKQNNMSQEELANALFVSTRTISKWENGDSEPSSSNLNAIADVFHVSVDYLLDREEVKLETESKGERVYSKTSIALGVLFVVFIILVLTGLGFSTYLLSTFFIDMAKNSTDAAKGVEGIGPSFAKEDIVEATIKLAASQGVTINANSDTFIQWQNSLKSLYTLHGDTYYYNMYHPINVAGFVWTIILEVYLISSLAITIYLDVLNAKSKLKNKRKLNTALAFISLNIPAGIVMTVNNMATQTK